MFKVYCEIHCPFQLFRSIFYVLGVQVNSTGFLDIFAHFCDKAFCFLRQQVHDQPVRSFSETPLFPQSVFPSHQNTLQEYLDYAKVTLVHLKVPYLNPFLSFFGRYLIGILSKPSDILSTTCKSSISLFSSVVVVLLPFGGSPLMTSTSILKNLEFYTLEQLIPR